MSNTHPKHKQSQMSKVEGNISSQTGEKHATHMDSVIVLSTEEYERTKREGGMHHTNLFAQCDGFLHSCIIECYVPIFSEVVHPLSS